MMTIIAGNDQSQVNVDGEQRYDQVYGDTFAMYSNKEMIEFIEPFIIRFQRNQLDAAAVFKGKQCFDAGCGNGRGTLFMLMNGAKHVTSYDFSEKNIESTKKFVRDFGYTQVTTKQGTLEEILYPDETFDFVWCNGVIMHTDHPNRCLAEITRILKTGGQAWIYIYGAGGVYWRVIHHLRDMLESIPIQKTISALKAMRYSTRYIAEFIDDWYATNLRAYTHEDLEKYLVALGYEKPSLLKFGMEYDTSHRRNTYTSEEEQTLMGEGDLRYLLTKKQHSQTQENLISEDEYGSDYKWPAQITDNIDPLFEQIKETIKANKIAAIMVAAFIQRELRIVLDKKQMFSIEEITQVLKTARDYTADLVSL